MFIKDEIDTKAIIKLVTAFPLFDGEWQGQGYEKVRRKPFI